MVQKQLKQRRAKRLPKGPNGGVQLLLIHSVDNLGKQGDLVEVKPGFANNYLIPFGYATVASDHHVRMVEKHKVKLLEIESQRLSGLRSELSTLAEQSIMIEAKANEEGHLYGSVGPAEIVGAFKAAGFNLAEEMVILQGAIRELGLYTAMVRLHSEVEGEIKFWVVASEEE
ncbi:MAG: 50S ribosomal protein L9 [Planctomycetota bacterium]|nr:50S ribosomal protein L9 [Planctomycetota bacterium]